MPETPAGEPGRKPGQFADNPMLSAFDGGYWEGMRRIQKECATFMADRLEHDRTTLQELSRCTDFADLMAVQQRWMARCSESYMREGPKLASMALETFTVAPRAPGAQDRRPQG